jgi:hypothetical protein
MSPSSRAAGHRLRQLSVLVAGLTALAALVPATLASASQHGPQAQILYVSPGGQGTSCSAQLPCDVAHAQTQVRLLDRNMAADIVVQLTGGTYRLDAPLNLTSDDSGTNGHKVIWQAAAGTHPVLSGGRQITGWHLTDPARGVWAADVAGSLQTRQLYVNGMRAPIAQGPPPAALTRAPGGFTAADDSYAHLRNPANMEFVFTGGNGAWTESRCGVSSVSGTQITMSQPCWDNVTNRPQPAIQAPNFFPNLGATATPNRIENTYELLQSGQWYLDHGRNTLYYAPPNGLDPNHADIEAPVLQTLVAGNGTLDKPVHDIVLRGLQFSYATWLAPSGPDGFSEIQANVRITGDQTTKPQGTCTFTQPAGTCPFGANAQDPGNVTFRAAHDITVEDNTFTHLGAAGLAFGYGSQHNLIQGNTFTDISAIGISLGNTNDPHPSDVGADDREINLGNIIKNNYIHDIGVEFAGADGILLLYTQHTTVTHNEISHVPWDGIDSGVNAGHVDTAAHPDVVTNINSDNVISDNLIYDYHATLSDGGAIYLEGHQGSTIRNADGSVNEEASFAHGTRITGNVVYNQLHGGMALYDDIGSQWISWQHNVEFNNGIGNGGCAPIGHIRFQDNYYSDQIGFFPCAAAVDLQYANNISMPTHVGPADLPADIVAQAGLEPAFRHLVTGIAPQVDTISPRGGVVPTAAPVLITGSGFPADSMVSFGGVPATSIQVLTPTFIVATAPAGASTAEATVTTSLGTYSGPSGLPVADVTADSQDSEAQWHTSFDPFNVVDGNLGSFWGSGETAMPHWVQVRFTHPVSLGKVVVQARRLDGLVIDGATVSASVSGSAPTMVGSVTGNSAQDIPFSFASPVVADTIRVQVTSESYQGSPRIEADIAQLQFYDTSGRLLGNG